MNRQQHQNTGASQQRFDTVGVLVFDTNRQLRQALVSHLKQTGFRNIEDTDRWTDVTTRLTGNKVDLLLATIRDKNDLTASAVLRDMRRREVGQNPFVLATLMTTDKALDTIRILMETGPDDVLVTPVAVGNVHQRIMALVRGRKPFAITAEYVGPDRRNGQVRTGAEEIPLLLVPNPLRAKVTGEGLAELDDQIRQVTKVIGTMRIERAVRLIVFVGNRLPALSPEASNGAAESTELRRMKASLETLRRLIPGTVYKPLEALAAEIANAIQAHGNDPTIWLPEARENMKTLTETLSRQLTALRPKEPKT